MKKSFTKFRSALLILSGGIMLYVVSCNSEAHDNNRLSTEKLVLDSNMHVSAEKLPGIWIEQNTDSNIENPLPGYEFKKDGTLIPLNISTLNNGNWHISRNTLYLTLKSSEEQSVDTLRYKMSISKDELILTALNSNVNTKETYLRIR